MFPGAGWQGRLARAEEDQDPCPLPQVPQRGELPPQHRKAHQVGAPHGRCALFPAGAGALEPAEGRAMKYMPSGMATQATHMVDDQVAAQKQFTGLR